MTTLITGATGFVGSRVAEAFLAAGHPIVFVSRTPEKHTGRAFQKLPAPDAPDAAFDRLMQGIENVVHCAAMNNDAVGATASDFQRANAVLTRRLAEAASRSIGGRFVYLSSSHAVWEPSTGEQAANPSPYGRSKREGELAVAESFSQQPGRATVLRLPVVYGAGMRNRLAQLLAFARRPIPLPVTGLEKRYVLVSRDAVAEAVLHLVFRAGPLQPVYFASDSSAVSIPEIVGAFRDGLGRRRLIFRLPGSRQLEDMLRRQSKQPGFPAANHPALLIAEGWSPERETLQRLRELARGAA